jgi:hypothetical protein
MTILRSLFVYENGAGPPRPPRGTRGPVERVVGMHHRPRPRWSPGHATYGVCVHPALEIVMSP